MNEQRIQEIAEASHEALKVFTSLYGECPSKCGAEDEECRRYEANKNAFLKGWSINAAREIICSEGRRKDEA